jgi:hypothetical protein
MSNNIYDILKKMENLEAPKQTLTEGKKAKPDYIDIDKDGDKTEPMKKAAKEKSKGAVAEAVARVEKKLAEKYLNHKKKLGEESDMIRKVIPVGVIDGPGGYEEAQKRIKDHESSKVKRQELPGKELPPVDDRSRPADKPKTKEVDESGLQAYLGKKKYGEQGMQALQKAGRDGASKEKMARIRAQHDKMDEGETGVLPQFKSTTDSIMTRRKQEAEKRAARDKTDQWNEFQKQLDFVSSGDAYRDSSDVDYDRHGNPAFDVNTRRKLEKDRTYPVYRTPGIGDGMPDRPVPGKMDEDSYNEDMLSPKQKKFAALAKPKDKITYADKIAGAKKKTEGNKFSGNLAKARAQGLKQADLDGDGKMEPVREGWDDMMKAAKERSGPQPSGGSGIKQGTRYGGGRQTDEPDTDNETGEVAKKGRGRPKKDKFAR